MNYITMPAGEPIMYEYPEYDYVKRYLTAGMQEFGEIYEPRYERFPSVHTMEASYLLSGAEARLLDMQAQAAKKTNRDTDDWKRFIHQPKMLFSNDCCKEVNENMEQIIQAKLDSYMELLEQIKQKTDDERTAVSLLQEVSKDRRMEAIRDEREAKNSMPATEKQKKFMKKLGIDFPDTVTKQEASMLIDEELGKNGG